MAHLLSYQSHLFSLFSLFFLSCFGIFMHQNSLFDVTDLFIRLPKVMEILCQSQVLICGLKIFLAHDQARANIHVSGPLVGSHFLLLFLFRIFLQLCLLCLLALGVLWNGVLKLGWPDEAHIVGAIFEDTPILGQLNRVDTLLFAAANCGWDGRGWDCGRVGSNIGAILNGALGASIHV